MTIRKRTIDDENEEAFARRIEPLYDWTLYRMPKLSRVDWVAADARGAVVAVCELKCKGVTMRAHNHVLIDLYKLDGLQQASRAFGGQAYLFTRFSDGNAVVVGVDPIGRRGEAPLRAQAIGRTDRDDPSDIHPCLYIPLSSCTMLGDSPDAAQGRQHHA